jgi:hypothetical protein
MIRVTVELLPFGLERGRRTLATMDIANDGTGTQRVGNYRATLYAEYTGEEGRKGRLVEFKRNEQSVMTLVGSFLKLFGHTKHSPKLMEKL